MKIKSLTLKNFRGFVDARIDFSENMTIVIGINGAGKTSILDALAILLSWGPARIRSANGRGALPKTKDINNSANQGSIDLHIEPNVRWFSMMNRPGHEKGVKSDYEGVNAFATGVRERITKSNEQCSIPVMIYYPVDRAVLDIPLRIRKKHDFELLETYEGSLTAGADFRKFFEWFRNREDLENEQLTRCLRNGNGKINTPLDRQLEAVRKAVLAFLPDLKDIFVERKPLSMIVERKNGDKVKIQQLSDGEKCLLALVGDLARRLAIANPTLLKDPLEGDGVVLIDEIELHLHPAWQRSVIGDLRRVFPNCQFIVSTHSPQVLGEVKGEDIRCITVGKDGMPSVTIPRQSLGLDSNQVLEEVLGAPSRNEEITKRIGTIFRDIDKEDKNSLARARRAIKKLKKELDGSIPDLVEAEALLFMQDGE